MTTEERPKDVGEAALPEELQRFTTKAKRHHYVPEFSLRRFSTDPTAEHPPIHQLDVRSGKTSRASTQNCAVIQHHNTLYRAPQFPPGFVEALLSDVEARAAPVIEDLVAGRAVSDERYLDLAGFVYVQQQRTPRGREWTNFALEQGGRMWLLKQLYENRDVSRTALTEELGRPPTDQEVSDYVARIAEPFENDSWTVQPHRDDEVLGMFLSLPTVVPLIYEKCWWLLDAPVGERFILSDDPVVRHDTNNPDGPAGWGSPTVDVSLPLDPHLCLVLTHYPARTVQRRTATPGEVLELNLRTYAGAREFIYAPVQGTLQQVRTAAKADPGKIARYTPKPPKVHLIDNPAGSAPHVVKVTPAPTDIKIRRGRPPANEQTT